MPSKRPELHSEECRRCGWSAASRRPAKSDPGGSRAEPLLRGRLLEKGRLLEPKSPSGQNARLQAGIEKETEGVTHGLYAPQPPAIPIAPLQVALMRPDVFPSL